MTTEATKTLATYALLGQLFRESQAPAEPTLELVANGWRLWPGEHKDYLPLTTAEAYEIACRSEGIDEQQVLDQTRRLCGDLRMAAKRKASVATTLSMLRGELAQARELKARREEES